MEESLTVMNWRRLVLSPGTILGTVRRNPVKEGKLGDVLNTLEKREIDVLIAMGGDDTLGVANRLAGGKA